MSAQLRDRRYLETPFHPRIAAACETNQWYSWKHYTAVQCFTTVQQESVLAVATQRRELHGPPAYFTQDWRAAGESVGRLAALQPEVLGSGHGQPVRGEPMRAALRNLASRFERDEVPSFGRYAGHPAITDERGIVRLPPDPLPKIVAGIAVAIKPRYGAYLVAAWLGGIIVNLLSFPGFYDIALRDFGLLVGALALARLAARFDPPGLALRSRG